MTIFFFLGLGIVNWFGTLLIVESKFFDPFRKWIFRREFRAERRLTVWFWSWIRKLITCHMCTGTWVGMALVPWAPMIFGVGFFPYIITGLLIKGIGHGFLVLHKLGEEMTREHKHAADQLRNGTADHYLDEDELNAIGS